MSKHRKSRKSKRQHGRRRSAIAAPSAAANVRRHNVLIGVGSGVAVVVLVVVAVLVFANIEPKEPRSDAEVVYHGIEGGFTKEGFPYLGSLEADVVLTEFTDFYCSHCRTYNLETEDSILEEYVATGQVRYVLYYYSNGSPQSLQAMDAAMCAGDQGLGFQFQRGFFETPAVTREDFVALARDLGLAEDDFLACWDAGRHRNALMGHIQAARSLGVSATPSFIINDQLVVGNRSDMVRQAIEDELAAD